MKTVLVALITMSTILAYASLGEKFKMCLIMEQKILKSWALQSIKTQRLIEFVTNIT